LQAARQVSLNGGIDTLQVSDQRADIQLALLSYAPAPIPPQMSAS